MGRAVWNLHATGFASFAAPVPACAGINSSRSPCAQAWGSGASGDAAGPRFSPGKRSGGSRQRGQRNLSTLQDRGSEGMLRPELMKTVLFVRPVVTGFITEARLAVRIGPLLPNTEDRYGRVRERLFQKSVCNMVRLLLALGVGCSDFRGGAHGATTRTSRTA